jgi:hypothetical protein
MLAYDDLSEALIRAVPELQMTYEIERKAWRGQKPGQHVMFGNIVPPFLASELQGLRRRVVLNRAFSFFENMANDPDVLVQEVVQQEVLASLCGRAEWKARAKRFIGPRSAALMREYCDSYHRPHE